MENYRKKILEAGLRMQRTGMTLGTWGNISIRDPEKEHIYITPSGMPYNTLVEEDIVQMDLSGRVLCGTRRPSIETGMHLKIYSARKDCGAVIHTHAVHSTVFASVGKEIPLFLDEAAQYLGDTVRVTEYALPGTQELAEQCVQALGERGMACLVCSHGAVSIGANLEQAFTVSEVLETTARVYRMILAMGGLPQLISEENIDAMQRYVRESYGQIGEKSG